MRIMRMPITLWLLACFGMLLPVAATPVRICFLGSHLAMVAKESGCCDNCTQPAEGPQPCCMDLEALPEASTPEVEVVLPPIPICVLPDGPAVAPVPSRPVRECMVRSTPIRGPDTPTAWCAVINVWRL